MLEKRIKKKTLSIDLNTKEGKMVIAFFSRLGYSLSDFVVALVTAFLNSSDIYDADKIDELSKTDMENLFMSIKNGVGGDLNVSNDEIKKIQKDIESIKNRMDMFLSASNPSREQEKVSEKIEKDLKTDNFEKNHKKNSEAESEKSDNSKEISKNEIKNLKNILDNW